MSACWVRVNASSAGQNYGKLFILAAAMRGAAPCRVRLPMLLELHYVIGIGITLLLKKGQAKQ